MNTIIKKYKFLILSVTLILGSCKKYLEVDPPREQLLAEYAFTDESSADAVVTGMYTRLLGQLSTATRGASMSADELFDQYNSITSLPVQNNALKPEDAVYVKNTWVNFYQVIYAANVILEQVDHATKLTDAVKQQLKGEALFTRAYMHFLLTNLWGDVPYITATDVNSNSRAARTSADNVYKNILQDLKSAESSLPPTYPTPGRARPNQAVAAALLAEVYLYKGDWANAETEASKLINNPAYALETDLNNVFLRSSKEVIWALNTANGFTNDGLSYVASSGAPVYLLRDGLVNAFEPNDKRKESWVRTVTVSGTTYNSPYKYKQRTTVTTPTAAEDLVQFRLAEQYLIRAEARLKQNNLPGAIEDVNAIRERAGLSDLDPASTSDQITQAIEQERRMELMTEGFHRWFDLKRTNRADQVLGALKPTWTPTAVLFPVPSGEILINPNLTQNAGYQ